MNTSVSWLALEQHYQIIKNSNLLSLFNADSERGKKFALEFSGLYFDYSKNHINQETINLFSRLANESQLKNTIEDLFTGKIVNKSENRPALHSALRDINNTSGINKEIHTNILAAQEKTASLANQLKNKQIKNRHGKSIEHLICLGIGGSYLGPKLVIDALQDANDKNILIRFVASIDPNALHEATSDLNLEECVFFIASKSFNTLETLTNAKVIKDKLLKLGLNQTEISNHFIAATENIQAALDFGCIETRILPLWDFIGGRFSLWSSIGFPVLVSIGNEKFHELLNGAYEMDRHFLESPFEKNMPFLLACISIWYQNFFNASTHAVIVYDHKLKIFPAFLQQLEMESLGKSVNTDGEELTTQSGAIIWGSEGPNSQHAFHQLLHQGLHLIPCDFLVCKHSPINQQQQDIIFSECVAQSRTLMIGSTNKNAHENVKGNKPSNTIVLNKLAAKELGALLALYEHKIFVQAALLDINPFDQWGVQLGKVIGKEIAETLKNNTQNALDSSSDALIKYYKK